MSFSLKIEEEDGTQSVIYYHPQFFTKERIGYDKKEAEDFDIRGTLDSLENWKGKMPTDQWCPPRHQIWSSTRGLDFTDGWGKKFDRWSHQDYSPGVYTFQKVTQKLITPICEKLQIKTPEINSTLLNKYYDNTSRISLHQDAIPEFGPDPTIICCSFGESRTFNLVRTYGRKPDEKGFRINKDEQHLNQSFPVGDGDLLIMAGACQRYFAHEVPPDKSEKKLGVRYSCILREHRPVEEWSHFFEPDAFGREKDDPSINEGKDDVFDP